VPDRVELALVDGSDISSKRAASRCWADEVRELSVLQLPDTHPPASGLWVRMPMPYR
jgi:hypothetical protein